MNVKKLKYTITMHSNYNQLMRMELKTNFNEMSVTQLLNPHSKTHSTSLCQRTKRVCMEHYTGNQNREYNTYHSYNYSLENKIIMKDSKISLWRVLMTYGSMDIATFILVVFVNARVIVVHAK